LTPLHRPKEVNSKMIRQLGQIASRASGPITLSVESMAATAFAVPCDPQLPIAVSALICQVAPGHKTLTIRFVVNR
jgi:hypothetical protein